ncbi:MAG: DNA-binding protein [Gammaproteobacteria bacterium]|nr:DNA-binding protein [Gammaproteobacteria bacterium]
MTLSIREKVFQAADELLAASGRTPSIRQVLEKTGGSSTTVQKYLKEWQDEQARRAQQPGFPLPVQRALGEVWDQLVAAAKQVFDEEREGYESRLQVLEHQAQGLEEQLAEAQARATAREAELVQLQSLADQEARCRRELELEAEGLRGQLALGRQALEASAQRLEEERKSHQNAADDLKLGHAEEIARLQQVIERSENHLLRQLDEARRQVEQLKTSQAAELAAVQKKLEADTAEHRKRIEALMLELREVHVTLSRERAERSYLQEKNTALEAELKEGRKLLDEARSALAVERAATAREPAA